MSVLEASNVYESELKPKLERYVNIMYDRVAREGNLSRVLNDVDERYYNVYVPTDIGHGFRLHLRIRIEMQQVCYYLILDIINRARNPNSSRVNSFFMWAHHRSATDAEFHPTESDRTDMIQDIGASIQRLSQHLPLRLCKEKHCDTLLTARETDYCIECESTIGSTDCSLCLDSESVQKLIQTRCGHTFHFSCFQCIHECEYRTVKCPLCRMLLNSYTGQ